MGRCSGRGRCLKREAICGRVECAVGRLGGKESRDRYCRTFKEEYRDPICQGFKVLLDRGLEGKAGKLAGLLRERTRRTFRRQGGVTGGLNRRTKAGLVVPLFLVLTIIFIVIAIPTFLAVRV